MIWNLEPLCQHYLNYLYQSFNPCKEIEAYKEKDLSATQGEILYGSINELLSEISLNQDDIFYDLGSGMGKVTLQVFLKTPVKEACGIEFIPSLYEQSIKIGAKVKQDLPEFYVDDRKLRFIQGDFLETSFDSATVVFINSICFNQKTLLSLGRIIDQNSRIHTLLSLRPLPTIKRLRFVKIKMAEGSWDSALCYFYSLR